MVHGNLTRQSHLERVCGTGTGPETWRTSQFRQQTLTQQTRALAGEIDRLGWRTRRELAARLAQLIAELDDEERRGGWVPAFVCFRESVAELAEALVDQATTHHALTVIARTIEEQKNLPQQAQIDGHRPWPVMSAHLTNRFLVLVEDAQAIEWATPPASDQPILLGLVTESVRELENFRPLRMLPLIAQRERKPLLDTLKLWMQDHARKDEKGEHYARFFVVTNGCRVGYDQDLRRAIRDMQRLISRWAKISRDEWDVDIIFRATEMTLDPDGAHVHANIIADPQHALGGARWAEYLSAMRGHFGAWIRDNGRVQRAEEIVKYALKPTEIDRQIMQHDDDQTRLDRLAWLYRGLRGSRLVAPLGALKELWAEVERQHLKPVNLAGKILLTDKYRPEKAKEKRPKSENVIVGEVLSNRVHTPWAEPSVLVLGYTKTPETTPGQRGLEKIQQLAAEAAAAWANNGAPTAATAKAVAEAWLEADNETEAGKVWAISTKRSAAEPFSPRPQAGEGGVCTPAKPAVCSIVHTSRLTVRDADVPPAGAAGLWLDRPPPIESGGYLYDPDTGEELLKLIEVAAA